MSKRGLPEISQEDLNQIKSMMGQHTDQEFPDDDEPMDLNIQDQGSQGFQMPDDTDDYQLWPGGPYDSQLQSWKKQFEKNGHKLFMTPMNNGRDRFIWRTLTRYEYKIIMAAQHTDQLVREEMICQTVVLWPQGYNFEAMAPGRAGYPAVLARQIMKESGFVDVTPTML